MSRTDKDRPTVVKVNDGGRGEVHHHEDFGRVIEGTRKVRDKDGNVVYDEIPIWQKAQWANVPQFLNVEQSRTSLGSFSSLRYIDDVYVLNHKVANPLYWHVQMLRATGQGDTQVFLGTRKVPRTEQYVKYVIKDYCTIDEPWDGNWRFSPNPCHRELSQSQKVHQPKHRSEWERTSQRSARSGDRVKTRMATRKMARAAVQDEDWEDGFDRESAEISAASPNTWW